MDLLKYGAAINGEILLSKHNGLGDVQKVIQNVTAECHFRMTLDRPGLSFEK
jgi:hypothetical protein